MSESDQKEDGVRQDTEKTENSASTAQPNFSPLASPSETGETSVEKVESVSETEQREVDDLEGEETAFKPQGIEENAPDPKAQETSESLGTGESLQTTNGDSDSQPSEKYEKKWYVVHTYSGYENKARQTLLERIKRENMSEFFGQILIPTEEVVEMKRGKRRTSKRKFFPGYMLVQMNMTESSWYLVKSTPKITGFVGDSTNPLPVPEIEVKRIANQIVEGAERIKPKIVFEKGDSVRIVDGPFVSFNGVVDEVESEKGKLRVLVSIFGRATPVEMEFVQVEKI